MAEKNMSNSLSRQGITYQEKAEDQHNNINTSQNLEYSKFCYTPIKKN